MRVSYATIAALMASVAHAQSIADLVSQIPSCALTCLATAATSARCGLTDYACQCGPAMSAITKSAAPCIASSCTADQASKVLTISNEICAAVNSVASSSSPIAGVGPTVSPSTAPTTAPAASPTTSATSPTSPAQSSGNVGPKVQTGAVIAGAAVLAAFAL